MSEKKSNLNLGEWSGKEERRDWAVEIDHAWSLSVGKEKKRRAKSDAQTSDLSTWGSSGHSWL